MTNAIRVLIWNEGRHERDTGTIRAIYPDGMHGAIAAGLCEVGEAWFQIATATLDEPGSGLGQERLAETDVLVWWGHNAHDEVADEIVERVRRRVLEGMGIIVLHSGHHSKIFKALMGTTCDLKWRVAGDKERLWVVAPGHPIVEGIGEYIELPDEEMYGEHFDIPEPETLVFVSWFSGGEIFRSGCCYGRGAGKIFYFRPGHETFPTYFNPEVRRVIANAVRWAAPVARPNRVFGNVKPLETLPAKAPA